jgi:hypothetical protein
MAGQPSRHFFEGYSRSKDLLTTIANNFAAATTEKPWVIKQALSDMGASPRAHLSNKSYVCISHEVPNGNNSDLIIVDEWHTHADPNTPWGRFRILAAQHNGFVPGDLGASDLVSAGDLEGNYHQNQVPDSDSLPQYAWYWMWIDDEMAVVSIFGNSGATGSATPSYMTFVWGMFHPMYQDGRYEVTDGFGVTTNNTFHLWKSVTYDYQYPERAPHNWVTDLYSRYIKQLRDQKSNDSATANPDSITGDFIATMPKLAQAYPTNSYGGASHWHFTHFVGSNQLLLCNSGDELVRGDIVTIDSEHSNYVYHKEVNTEWRYHLLVKRSESPSNLSATPAPGQIDLEWINPVRFLGIKIVRKVDSPPMSPSDGDVILGAANDAENDVMVPGEFAVFSDTTVAGTTNYHYAVFAYDSNGTHSVPIASAYAEATSL